MSGKESLSEVHSSVHTHKRKGWRRILAFIGPAYLVSVGYMDPGNWATDLAGGSQFGYKLLWVLLMSNLIALLLQSLSARLGIVRGLDLAQASRSAYPKWVNFPLFVLAQLAIIACDLAEIIGMAIGLNLLFGLPLIWGVSVTILDTFLLLFLMNRGMRAMERFIVSMVFIVGISFLVEMFIVSMVFIVGISFLVEMFIVEPVFGEVIAGLKPSSLSGDALYIAIGIIGATVMPHNLYLHSSLVQTRKIERDTKGIKEALRFNLIDTSIALNLAFFVNAAILILAAAAFYKNGHYEIAEIQDAYVLLEHIFGKTAPTLFAIALIAAGQSSTITGTLAGQIIMEGHINLRIQPWLRRLLTRLLAIIPAFFTILYFGENSLGALLVLSQVVLSLQLGFAIIPLIHITADKKRMNGFHIKPWVQILAWASAILILALNIKLVQEELTNWSRTISPMLLYGVIIPVTLFIAFLLVFIFVYPLLRKDRMKAAQVPHGKALQIDEIRSIEYTRVAVAVDFSKNDKNIIQHALIQGGKSAEYFLIHIVETAVAQYHGDAAFDQETQSDMDNLNQYKSNLNDLGYNIVPVIGYGRTAGAIAKAVIENKADLLVMGAHGHRIIKDIIFGTTVDAVRHKVTVPILIVR